MVWQMLLLAICKTGKDGDQPADVALGTFVVTCFVEPLYNKGMYRFVT